MSIQVGDNFTYKGQKPLDARLVFNTIPDMVATPSTIIYDGILVYVLSEKKFYTYNSTNTVDVTLDKWRELTTSSITISSAAIDRVTTSPTYKHLILTLSDGTTIDCGDATGDKGDQGKGFAIIKLYSSTSDMTSDTSPVNDGEMVAVINNTTSPITAKVYIRNSSQTANATTGDENGYTFFCNLADATVIQGPQGPKGDKGDTPVITITTVPATATVPEGKKITFTTGTGATATSVSTTIYNGINLKTAAFNASNELILTLTDGSTINLGQLSGNGGNTYVTILGCFDNTNIPTSCNIGDIYFNTDTNMLYECKVANTWDTTGSIPTNTDIYISLADRNLYAYADNTWQSYGGGKGGSVTISKKYNNALKEITGSTTPSEDGLYVENLQPKIDRLNIAQKTINSQLEYFSAHGSTRVTINKGTNINYLPYLTTIETNLDGSRYDNNGVILLGGKTYRLSISLLKVMASDGISYMLSDDAGNKFGNRGYCGSTSFSDASVDIIYTPTTDIKVHPALLSVTSNANFYPDCSSFTIAEVNRSIVIDPVEYVNTKDGIEDIPVGSIIQRIGNTPKHYLPCNGSVYNISDYPSLAQQFMDEFGMYNYYGGDGSTTFAVPNMNVPSTSTIVSPKMTSNTTPSPYKVTVSSNWNNTSTWYWRVFDRDYTTTDESYAWISSNKDSNPWIDIDLGSRTSVDYMKLLLSQDKNKYPSTFTLQGSDDGTNYTDIQQFTNVENLPFESDNFITFNLSHRVTYRFYRIYIDNIRITSGNTYVRLYEWELYKKDYKPKKYIKYEPTYFMTLEPQGYETLDIDTGRIDVSLDSSDTKIRTLWSYTHNNTQNQPAKLQFKNMSTYTNTNGKDGFVTVEVDNNVIQTVQCPAYTTVKFNVDKLTLQPGQTIEFKTNWTNTHTGVTWKLQGNYAALSNSI